MTTQTVASARAPDEKVNKIASIPFVVIHLLCFAAIWTGFGVRELVWCVALYYVRMFGVTAGYHRYFSHRAYKTNRVFQFLLAFLASTSAQKGVLWWAANHRHHHRESDQPADIHSPVQKGFWFSHVGWILCDKYGETRYESIRDFARFPELVWLNKLHLVPPTLLGIAVFFIGGGGASGFKLLVGGFFLSTVLLWHGTFTINSLSHVYGSRRYKTTDTSRNNWLLALITCGEGWHNNHHYYQNTANQGWFWWEVDFSYYVLKAFSVVGLVSDLRTPSESVKLAHLKYSEADKKALREYRQPKRHELVVPSALQHPAMAMRAAAGKAKEAITTAVESLPHAGSSPQPLLKQ